MGKASMSLLVATMLGFLVLCGSAWGSEPIEGLISYWRFDDGSGITALDCIGGNNGTVHGAVWATGQVGGALSFDGLNDYVDVGDKPSLDITGDQITVMAWFKPAVSGMANLNRQIVSKWLGTDSAYTLGYDYINTDTILFGVYTGVNGVAYGPVLVNDPNQWYHLAGVYDGNEVIVYIDGVAGTGVNHTGNINNSRQPLRISGYGNGRRVINGTIDEVAIYNRALSAEEIQQHYQSGLSGHGYPVERIVAIINIEDAVAEKQESLELIDEALEKEWNAYDALEVLLESGYYGDLNKRDIVKAKQEIHSAMQRQERSADALEGSIEKLYDALAALGWEPEPEPEPNLVSYWKFDEGSGAIAYDSVGGNVGIIYGDAAWTAGQVDGALSFDGDWDYVDCGNTFASVTGSTTKTITAWAKSDTADYSGQAAGNGRIITLYRESGYSGFSMLAKGSPATWQGLYAIAGNLYNHIDSGLSVTANEWTHIVLVQDGAGVYIYINGVLANSSSDGAAPTMRRLVNADISAYDGEHGDIKCFFEGAIDEIRIYDRALAAEEIQELYLDGL